MKHISSQFDEELKQLDNQIARLGGLAEMQLSAAIETLALLDRERVASIVAADQELDDIEAEIEQLVIRMIALRQPVAEDLRILMAAMKISSNLERIGDYAKNIAKRTTILAEAPPPQSIGSVCRLGRMVQGLIHNVLDAYLNRDSAMAEDVRQRDEEVDQMHSSLFREIISYMIEDPHQITTSSHLLFIAKNIERMGDHATNIAEKIIYLVEGRAPADERPKHDLSSVTAMKDIVVEDNTAS